MASDAAETGGDAGGNGAPRRAVAAWVRNVIVVGLVAAATAGGSQYVRNAIVEARVDKIDERVERVAEQVDRLEGQTATMVATLDYVGRQLEAVALELGRGRRWTFEDQTQFELRIEGRFDGIEDRLNAYERGAVLRASPRND